MTGREVRELRSAMGLSAADFAALLGYSERNVYRWQRPRSLDDRIVCDPLRIAILDAMRQAVNREQDLELLGQSIRLALHASGPARALHRLFVVTFGEAA